MIPPVPETPLDRWLKTWLPVGEYPLAASELRGLVRTAQREAAERGFYAGITANRQYMPGTFTTSKEQWESSALKAELEQPT